MTLTSPPQRADILLDLERHVLSGALQPGDALPSERELGARYGVSRPVIREVLAGLVERGFIEVHPGRGSFVRPVAVDDLANPLTRAAARAGITARDLVVARLGLECSAVELAARQPRRPIATLRSLLKAHESATTVTTMAQTDLDLHEALVAAAGNPVLMLMFGAIRSQVFSLMLRSHSDATVRHRGEPLHSLIVDALEKGDAEGVRGLMRRHLELAYELYGADLDRPITEVVEDRGLRAAAPLARPRLFPADSAVGPAVAATPTIAADPTEVDDR